MNFFIILVDVLARVRIRAEETRTSLDVIRQMLERTTAAGPAPQGGRVRWALC